MAGMSIDGQGNIHRGRGAGGGQFQRKGRAPQDGGGLADGDDRDVPDVPELTPADVRTPEFTVESLRYAIGQDHIVAMDFIDKPEDRHVEWVEGYSAVGGGTGYSDRLCAGLDENGDLTGLRRWVDGVGGRPSGWVDEDPDGRRLHDLRHKVNLDRLAAAGILTHGTPNDGGAYGRRFTGGRAAERIYDAAAVSKLIRADIKKAAEFGAIPDGLKYRVRTAKFAGGQSIDIYAEGTRDDLTYKPDPRAPEDVRGMRHPWLAELSNTLEVIGNQWQSSEVDAMTDYFNVRYYLVANVVSEGDLARRRQFEEREAARKTARAARQTARRR